MDNTKKQLLDQIEQALGGVNFGSVEIIVQNKKVTQISVRNIQKTSLEISQNVQTQTVEAANEDATANVFTVHTHFRRNTQ